MKRAAPILLAAVTVLVSQLHAPTNNAPLSAPDACPAWNKKQPESKANYFAYLRNPKNRNNPYKQYSSEPAAYHPANQRAENTSVSNSVTTRNTSSTRLIQPAEPARPKEAPAPGARPKTTVTAESPVIPEKKETAPVAQPQQKSIAETKAPVAVPPKSAITLNKTAASVSKKKSGAKKDKGVRVKKTRFRKNRAAKCPDF